MSFKSPLRGFPAFRASHDAAMGKVDVIYYLLRDEFITARAAGSVNGTPPEPGPGGNRVVVDAGGDLSISGGSLVIAGGAGSPDVPSVYYDAITRTGGRLLVARINRATALGNYTLMGFNAVQNSRTDNAGFFLNLVGINVYDGATLIQGLGAEIGDAWVGYAIILRASGLYALTKPDGYWLLLWVGAIDATATLYPGIAGRTANQAQTDFIRIPDALWLPTPFAYDTFTRADGALGNTETTGPDGQTVTARAWTTQSGVWAVSTNKAVATTAGIATLPSIGNGDYLIQCQVTTPAAGVTAGGLVVRWTDANNYWYIRILPGTAGNDFFLIERNGGVETIRAQADVDWAANTTYTITVVCEGTDEWRVHQNTTARLTYTAVNAFNATATVVGLRDEGNSNFKFDNVLVFPRGTNNEHSQLNTYSKN